MSESDFEWLLAELKEESETTRNEEELIWEAIGNIEKKIGKLARVICPKCGGNFKNLNSLRSHISQMHR